MLGMGQLAAMKRLVADGKVAKFATYQHGNGQIYPLLIAEQAILVRDDLANHGQFSPPPPEECRQLMRIASEFVVDDTIVFQVIRDIQEQQTTQDERLIKQHLVESGRVLPMTTQDHWSAQMVRRASGLMSEYISETEQDESGGRAA